MIKHIPEDLSVTFSEIPDEVSLCFNISNCQNHCEGCHSPYLRNNIGTELTIEELDKCIDANDGITCVCFMGDGDDKQTIIKLAKHIEEKYPKLMRALYTGEETVYNEYPAIFDYIKFGPYIAKYGPLTSRTTNQRLIAYNHSREPIAASWYMMDLTYKFWK